jgi:hypothetical protein
MLGAQASSPAHKREARRRPYDNFKLRSLFALRAHGQARTPALPALSYFGGVIFCRNALMRSSDQVTV